jgi:hypothetical protein
MTDGKLFGSSKGIRLSGIKEGPGEFPDLLYIMVSYRSVFPAVT